MEISEELPIFFEELPANCPPEEAYEPDNFTVYRMVKNIPPTEEDFYSHKKLHPTRAYKPDCNSRAASVFIDINKCKIFIELENNKGEKIHEGEKIVKLTLNKKSGKVQQTGQKSHYDWWIYKDGLQHIKCEEVT